MSIQKVNHNVWHAAVDQVVAKSASARTEWWDTNGWTDKVVEFEVDDSATVDIHITAEVSEQGYYELNNKTCTTDDYSSFDIVDAHTAKVIVRKDADDIDDLQRPIRSMRFFLENDEASTDSTFNVRLSGWS